MSRLSGARWIRLLGHQRLQSSVVGHAHTNRLGRNLQVFEYNIAQTPVDLPREGGTQ